MSSMMTLFTTLAFHFVFSAFGEQNGTWSRKGCQIQSTNETHTTCKCNHLTNFAILMQTKDVQVDNLLITFYARSSMALTSFATFFPDCRYTQDCFRGHYIRRNFFVSFWRADYNLCVFHTHVSVSLQSPPLGSPDS